MKYAVSLLTVALLLGLLLFPKSVLTGASDGAMLWWSRVVPTLLPYLVAVGMLMRLPQRPHKRKKTWLHPMAGSAFLLGSVGGYPVGARLLGNAVEQGRLDRGQAQRFCVFSNLMSPAFVVSMTAVGLYGNSAVALPLCLSLYLPVLGAFLWLGRGSAEPSVPTVRQIPVASALTDAIFDAVQSLLRIGGCIILCAGLCSLVGAVGVFSVLARVTGLQVCYIEAIVSGLLEMTCGLQAVSRLQLPLKTALSISAFLLQFGGISVLLQTLCFLPLQKPWRYLGWKALLGVLSALLCYVLTPLLLPQTATVFSDLSQVPTNASALLAVLIASGTGLMVCTVFLGTRLLRNRPCSGQ